MATHPFAIKLETAIDHARRMLEALRAAKKRGDEEDPRAQWWDWVDSSGRKRVFTHLFGHVDLGGLAAGGMERQAFGESGFRYDSKANEKNIDKELRRLNLKLSLEESECARKRAQANADAGREVQVPCPGVVAARDALRRYVVRRYTNIGPNSGGGGGGGF
jgi:hypothetical protein